MPLLESIILAKYVGIHKEFQVIVALSILIYIAENRNKKMQIWTHNNLLYTDKIFIYLYIAHLVTLCKRTLDTPTHTVD